MNDARPTSRVRGDSSCEWSASKSQFSSAEALVARVAAVELALEAVEQLVLAVEAHDPRRFGLVVVARQREVHVVVRSVVVAGVADELPRAAAEAELELREQQPGMAAGLDREHPERQREHRHPVDVEHHGLRDQAVLEEDLHVLRGEVIVRLREVAGAVGAVEDVELVVVRLADPLAVVETGLVLGLGVVDVADTRLEVVRHQATGHLVTALDQLGLAFGDERLLVDVEHDAARGELELAVREVSAGIEHDAVARHLVLDAPRVVADAFVVGRGGVGKVDGELVLAGRAALDARAVDLAIVEEHGDRVALGEVLVGGLPRLGRARVGVARRPHRDQAVDVVLGEVDVDALAGEPARLAEIHRADAAVVDGRVAEHHDLVEARGRRSTARACRHSPTSRDPRRAGCQSARRSCRVRRTARGRRAPAACRARPSPNRSPRRPGPRHRA